MNNRVFQSLFHKASLIQKMVIKTLHSLFVVLFVISFLTPEFSLLKLLESNRGQKIPQPLATRGVSCLFTNVSRDLLYTLSLVTESKSHNSVLHVIYFAPFR